MIPKIIHYCWFGGNPKPEIIEKCIASWRAFCPDWEIKEWNEDNYDVNALPFTATAYAAKKWAFVSDVARLDILKEHGGIYLDTDVEILAETPFDAFLSYDTVLVFETERAIASGLFFASAPDTPLVSELLESYQGIEYTLESETVNSIMNKPVIQKMFPTLRWDAKSQTIGTAHFMGGDVYHTLMRHHGTRSWCDDLPEYTVKHHPKLDKFLRNPKIFEFLEGKRFLRWIVPIYTFLVYDFLDLGPMYYIKRIFKKLRKK